MGYIDHDIVAVTFDPRLGTYGYGPAVPDVVAFREAMPEEYRNLVVGPIPTAINGDVTWVFAPDGSKSGWDTAEEVDEWRERFANLFTFRFDDGSTPFELVWVRYGSDHEDQHGGATIIRQQP